MAAFVTVNGFDKDELTQGDVRIAVVKVTNAQQHPVHKQKGWQELELTVEKVILGQKPAQAALSEVVFPSSIATPNSAWPQVVGKVEGRSFLMCWIGNSPCGLGLSVYFGPNQKLPLLVSGPNDKQVGALVKLLNIIGLADDNARRKAMRSAFVGADGLLSQMADVGLRELDSKHVNSPARYEQLVSILAQGPVGDGSFTILREMRDMIPFRGSADFKRWKGVYASRTTKDFYQFRSQVLASLWNEVIAKPDLNKEVRRSTMALLIDSPFFLGRGQDATDAQIIKNLESMLQDPIVEVRRTTIDTLLKIAKKLQGRQPAKGRSIRQLVKRAYEKESAPEEKIILQRRFQEIIGLRP